MDQIQTAVEALGPAPVQEFTSDGIEIIPLQFQSPSPEPQPEPVYYQEPQAPQPAEPPPAEVPPEQPFNYCADYGTGNGGA